LNWADHRPELLIIDDLEDKDEIRNDEIRKKQRDWFFSDVLKTEDKYGKPSTFIYIDTIKHEDSMLELLMESPEWSTIRLSICDADYNTYDPNYMTTEEVKAEVEEHRSKSLMDLFYMERMNIPISIEDAVFKEEYFKYYEDHGDELVIHSVTESGNPREEKIPTSRLLHVTIVDPAKTVQLHSAESAVVTLGVDRESHKIFREGDIPMRKSDQTRFTMLCLTKSFGTTHVYLVLKLLLSTSLSASLSRMKCEFVGVSYLLRTSCGG